MSPVPKRQTFSFRPSERELGEDYTFPERIVLSDESFEAFSAAMMNPGKPNEALRALFKK